MTIREALNDAAATLRNARLDTPYLDAVLLLCHTLAVPKERLFADLREAMPEGALPTLRADIDRRIAGVPVSYIRGMKEFYGREFLVDSRVLVPRPDTEILVDAALGLVDSNPNVRRVHDVCTGSGCVAITLKAERPTLSVSASDLSASALDVAGENAARLLRSEDARTDPLVSFSRSDLLAEVAGNFDLITANPPYLTSEEYAQMRSEGWPEPAMALDGGNDGLVLVRRLVIEAVECLDRNGYLCVETADPQVSSARTIMANAGFADVMTHTDLAGRGRVTVGRKPV